MENLVIRPATESDQADCEAVYEACLLKMPDVKGAVSEINEMLLMDWKHENYHQQGYPILVALLDNVLVGVGCLAPEKGWMKPAFGAEAAIIVKPSLHRRQIASRIWLALLADPFVKEKDIYVIYARVIGTNSAGINACLKAGFRHTGTLERFFHSIQRSDINRVYDLLYFECVIADKPKVPNLGWPPKYAKAPNFERLLSNISPQDLDYRLLKASDGHAIQEISDYAATTELYPMRTSLYPAGYGLRAVERMLFSNSPAVIVRDKRSKAAIGWSNFLLLNRLGADCINAFFSLTLPDKLMETEVVEKIWLMLMEANQALGDRGAFIIDTTVPLDDVKRRTVFTKVLGLTKAHSVSGAFVKFGRHRDLLVLRKELHYVDAALSKRLKAVREQSPWMRLTQEERDKLEPLTYAAPEGDESSSEKESWSDWFKRGLGLGNQ